MDQIELYRLSELETVIERGLKTFVEVGNALMEIRDGRLYRGMFGTFEDYCRERWGFTDRRARMLMSAAEAVTTIKTGTAVPVLPASERQARPLTRLEPEQQAEAWQAVVETAPNGKVTTAHVENVVRNHLPLTAANHAVSADPNYDGDEWYTPKEVIEAARLMMGTIDLDPASCKEAQKQIEAGEYYDKDADGLIQPWFGNVWLNPPYSTPLINSFIERALCEYQQGNIIQAVILTNNSSETKWFQSLIQSFPACFLSGRLKFWRPGHDNFGARQGQAIFYLGKYNDYFAEVFSDLGVVVSRYDHK